MEANYRIEKTTKEHFFKVVPRDYDSQIFFASYSNYEELINTYLSSSYAYTGFYKDDIIGIAGLFPIGPGNAEAWMFTSELLVKHPKFVIKHIKRHLGLAEKVLGINRIQALCVENFTQAKSFIELLGFKCETPHGMKNYGPNNETYYLYARTKNGH